MADEYKDKSEGTRDAGVSSLNQAKGYWQKILSGDMPSMMQAAAPAIKSVNDQADANRRELGQMGTARGGGAIQQEQELQSKQMADISNIIAGIQPTAAKQVESIADKELDFGTQQMREALFAMGLSKDVADEIIDSSIRSRPISMQANAAVRQQWSTVLGALGL